MNILRMADSVTGLFPKKISVTLIHAVNGGKIGNYKFSSESLPEKFIKPTVMEIEGHLWRITEAEVLRSGSYLRGKQIRLMVEEAEIFRQYDKFVAPTLAFPYPALTDESIFNDSSLSVLTEDWRQLEFLPLSQLPLIQDTINNIITILSSQTNQNALLGYDQQYVRENIGNGCLDIPFQEFFTLVGGFEKGNIRLGEQGYIKNGFSIPSENYVYYGTLENDRIKSLALQQFDSVEDEFMSVASKFGLVLVDWCNANVLSYEVNLEDSETPVAI